MDNRNQAPVRVSPFIRGARWSLLLVGIAYGNIRWSALNRKEQIKKAELERTRPEREARMKAEKERAVREEQEKLAKEIGVDMPAS